jgi:hypothetical protein
MRVVEFQESSIDVDAKIIADGLGLVPSVVQEHLRDGKITARYERGVADDEGRHRLTFFMGHRRFRIVVDGLGNVIQRSTINFSQQPLPASARDSR